MRARRLRSTGRQRAISRGIKKVAGFAAATLLVAGPAFSCKPKEQPKKPVPAECKPCPKEEPCVSYIDFSRLNFRTMQISVVKGAPLLIVDQEDLARKLHNTKGKREPTFKGFQTFTLGTVTEVDGTGFDLSLHLKNPKTVRISFAKPQYVNIGAVPFVLYAEYPTKKFGPSVLITYPKEIFQ